MTRPTTVAMKADRSRGGSLLTSTVQAIRGLLLKRGLALIPGDCGYVLACLAADDSSATVLNSFPKDAFGHLNVSFTSFYALTEHSNYNTDAKRPWLELSLLTTSILEAFTPGPITVICSASSNLPQGFATELAPTTGRKVAAVRISDSIAERQIAGATMYPLATRQLLSSHQSAGPSPITGFEQAVDVVSTATEQFGRIGWIAVEDEVDRFSPLLPTIVDASTGTPTLIQAGAVPMTGIEALARQLPASSFEDWG